MAVARAAPGFEPGLLEVVLSLFGLAEAEAADVATRPEAEDRALVAFASRARHVTRAAWTAANPHDLKEYLAQAALSPALADLELQMLREIDFGAITQATFARPIHLRPEAAARLGEPTAELLTEALRLLADVLRATPVLDELQQARAVDMPSPDHMSQLRHALVLGDVLSPSVARVLLTNMQGVAALLALVGALGGDERLPEWKGVVLGEIALQGAKAFQQLPSLDLRKEAETYAAFKTATFERLRQSPPDDDGWEYEDEPSRP